MARLPNGYARRHNCTAKDVEPAQLKLGTEIEMEHTRDRRIARQIALDHLCESKGQRYYVRSNVKHDRLLLPRNGLGTSCSQSPRIARGIGGALLGGLAGGVLGVLIGSAVGARKLQSAGSNAWDPVTYGFMTAIGVAGLGVVAGAIGGALPPEC